MLLFSRLSGSHDGTVRVWSKISQLCMKVLKIHQLHIHTMAYDGKLLYTGSSDRCVPSEPSCQVRLLTAFCSYLCDWYIIFPQSPGTIAVSC